MELAFGNMSLKVNIYNQPDASLTTEEERVLETPQEKLNGREKPLSHAFICEEGVKCSTTLIPLHQTMNFLSTPCFDPNATSSTVSPSYTLGEDDNFFDD